MAFGRLGSGGTGFGRLGSTGSGGGVAAPAGGAALLVGEANGFATDFLYATDAQRVAVKTAGTVVSSGTSFFTSSGTSSKWVYNAAGTLVNIPVGTLPIDHDPVTHAARGLLCEPAATNILPHSAMGRPGFVMPGNSASRTGGKSDPAGGLEAVEVVITAGEVGSGMNIGSVVTVTNGTTYIESAWCKGVAGQKLYFNAASAATQVLVTFTGDWQRVSTPSYVGAGGVTYFGFECYNRSGGAHLPAVTFQCWGGQVEPGTVATSHIPTLAAAVTRAADNVRASAASIGTSATAGSWWAEVYILSRNSDDNIIGSNLGGRPLFYNGGAYEMFEGALLYILVGSVYNAVHKAMSAFTSGSRAITANGLTPSTDAAATTTLLTPTDVYLGSGNSSNMHGYIRKIRYLPRRPSNAEMQTMTT